MKVYNYTAGPSYIHPEVVEQIQKEISKNNGLSMIERSHRGKEVIALFEESRELVRHLMHLNDDFDMMFLHGGASLQNSMIPYNIKTNEQAYYIDTGVWAKKAYDESCIIRPTVLLADSSDKNYNYIPKQFDWNGDGYLHITSNNTVAGTQFHDFSFTKKGFVAIDMCSDIMSRDIDNNQFGLIYAGLQKNLGVAGASVVIVRKDTLENLPNVPIMLSYKKNLEAEDRMLNTPPVFAVLACNIVMKWFIKQGGIAAIEKKNRKNAALVYEALEGNERFRLHAAKEDRSIMNVTFHAKTEKDEVEFNQVIKEKNIEGIKGHRKLGGYRASLYNQLPLEDAEYLADVIKRF